MEESWMFYWWSVKKGLITISPVRKPYGDWACNHIDLFDKMVNLEFGK
ncbi:hypothetical protein TREPR_1825 [Treponema primitia ZAS-2]|uniref:Uncharacterized protein n=1 Tax=Treponema primitia (strain ATCC BAA-887 / DSM 12427 / ZAS-2) TaxID=545694 RepID=F5YLX0_TREPZ|nr:hypothetical protein TREPR_1825 [Treponema primitia ZAS-2]